MKKTISVILLLLLMLTACTAPVQERTAHFADGYTIYYNPSDKMETEIAEYLSSKMSAVCVDTQISSDGAEPTEKRIVIGSLCAEDETLSAGQGRIVKNGQEILLYGFTGQMTCYAVDAFIKDNITGNTAPAEGSTPVYAPIRTEYETFTNQLDVSAADPWVVRKDDDFYYCWSGETCINVKKMSNFNQASYDGSVCVWTAPEDTMYSHEIWAPELHYLNGEWYIYFAADDGSDGNHRMYVLKGTSQDPTDPFTFVGKLEMSKDIWAIDGTVMQYKGELYFVFSGNLAGQQRIVISHMSDPVTIDSGYKSICSAKLRWETWTAAICEGPVALTSGDNAFIVYSASAGWTDYYSLGVTTLTGEDPLLRESWTKCETPLLTRDKDTYCTGHCSFVEAFDGTTWIVYHARHEHITGWGGREVRYQPVFWNGEIIIVGDPVKVDETLYLPVK